MPSNNSKFYILSSRFIFHVHECTFSYCFILSQKTFLLLVVYMRHRNCIWIFIIDMRVIWDVKNYIHTKMKWKKNCITSISIWHFLSQCCNVAKQESFFLRIYGVFPVLYVFVKKKVRWKHAVNCNTHFSWLSPLYDLLGMKIGMKSESMRLYMYMH